MLYFINFLGGLKKWNILQCFIQIFLRVKYSRNFLVVSPRPREIREINTRWWILNKALIKTLSIIGCSLTSIGIFLVNLENIFGWMNLNCRWNSSSLRLKGCTFESFPNGANESTRACAPLNSKAKISNAKDTKIKSLAMFFLRKGRSITDVFSGIFLSFYIPNYSQSVFAVMSQEIQWNTKNTQVQK